MNRVELWIGIFEDGLDIVMSVGSIGYIFLINDTEHRLSPATMAAIGGSGGFLRLVLRRLVTRIATLKYGKGTQ